MPSPTLSSSPSPSQDPAKVTPSPTSGSPKPASNRPSPVKTTHHRRRSSIIPATPSSKAAEIDRSLTETIRNLKLNATTRRTAVDLPESRWSSSDGSANESEDAAFFKARKSSESIRSRATSNKSKRSVKSRKSEETDCKDVKEVPPVPSAIPLTPGRSRRMMDGLVKRLGLTPRKNKLG